MCLIGFALNTHPDWPLIVAANRDEYFDRPTKPAHWAQLGQQSVFSGTDLRHGGRWMGVNRSGHWAAVTNVRGAPIGPQSLSRGTVVNQLLAQEQWEAVQAQLPMALASVDACNALVGRTPSAGAGAEAIFSNGLETKSISSGFHTLSNGSLDSPWPKSIRLAETIAQLIDSKAWETGAVALEAQSLQAALLTALMDQTIVPDEALPQTGIAPAMERVLSTAFIRTPSYGTRSSSVFLVHRHSDVFYFEQSYTTDQSSTIRKCVRTARFRL
jgi:uncharacterized protein with NRDE domain